MLDTTDATPAAPPKATETPAQDALTRMGEVLFLAMRSRAHLAMPLGTIRAWWAPPLEFGQVWVFRADGHPRAAISWAMLSAEAERRYVGGQGLRPGDWRSGDRAWIIDWIAPYKSQGFDQMTGRWVATEGFKGRPVRFMRVGADGAPRRIVETSTTAGGKQAFRIIDPAEFGVPA